MTKWWAIAGAIGALTARGGDSGPTGPTAPPANIGASYDATVIASSAGSANLPAETRALGFVATITQTGAAVQMQLIGKAPGLPETTVAGSVSGQTVSFPGFSFPAPMGRGAALSASGSADVAANGLPISGNLNGTSQTSAGASCKAANHQLPLVKLCPQSTTTGTALLPGVA